MRTDDSNLNDLLNSVRLPERSQGYWGDFPRRVIAQLSEDTRISATPMASSFPLWGFGLATAVAALLLCVGLWMRGRLVPAEPNYTKLYYEIESMFPNQVRAIVIESGGVRLELSDKPDIPSSSPLRVDVCHNQQCGTYITFSGQRIRVNTESWDVLSDRSGHVLVVGPNVIWTSAEPTRHAGAYHINAKPMRMPS